MLLGVDLGTSSVKAALYGRDGSTVAAAAEAYPTRRSGAVEEQDPPDWAEALRLALARVLPLGRPRAMAVTGQMSGLLLTDRQGCPVMPFLPWSDRRAEGEARSVADQFGGQALYRTTGCRAAAGYLPAKLKWVAAHLPEARARAAHVLGAREFLLAHLTDVYVTDPSSAGATGLYELAAGSWWPPMLEALQLTEASLPEVSLPWYLAGVTGKWATTVGLPRGVPVAVGAGDGPCSSWGAGATEPGDVVVSIGTSGVVRVIAEAPLLHPAAATTCYPLGDGLFAGTGVTSAAGAALAWGAHLLGLGGPAELEAEALRATPGAAGLLFIPDLGGSRTPRWDPQVRGAFGGLGLNHGREHLARAVFEGVALSLTTALQALQEAGAVPARLIVTGGGGHSQLLGGTLAGLTGLPTFRAIGGDATLGAAQLAGVAGGVFPNLAIARAAMAVPLEPVEPVPVPDGLPAQYRLLSGAVASVRRSE